MDIIKNAIKDLKDVKKLFYQLINLIKLLGGEHSILLIPGYIVLAEANLCKHFFSDYSIIFAFLLEEKRLEKAE